MVRYQKLIPNVIGIVHPLPKSGLRGFGRRLGQFLEESINGVRRFPHEFPRKNASSGEFAVPPGFLPFLDRLVRQKNTPQEDLPSWLASLVPLDHEAVFYLLMGDGNARIVLRRGRNDAWEFCHSKWSRVPFHESACSFNGRLTTHNEVANSSSEVRPSPDSSALQMLAHQVQVFHASLAPALAKIYREPEYRNWLSVLGPSARDDWQINELFAKSVGTYSFSSGFIENSAQPLNHSEEMAIQAIKKLAEDKRFFAYFQNQEVQDSQQPAQKAAPPPLVRTFNFVPSLIGAMVRADYRYDPKGWIRHR